MKKNLFEKCFRKTLTEDTLDKSLQNALEDQLKDNKEVGDNALKKSLDLGTEKEDYENYESNTELDKELQDHIEERQNEHFALLTEWIKKIDDFTKFVNDPLSENSIRTILDKSLPGSLFEKIKLAESRKFTRAATEAASLSQAIRSYLGAEITTKP